MPLRMPKHFSSSRLTPIKQLKANAQYNSLKANAHYNGQGQENVTNMQSTISQTRISAPPIRSQSLICR